MGEKLVVPDPPTNTLLGNARDKYFEIGKMLIEKNLWQQGDEMALLALCVSYSRWIKAEREIRTHDKLTFETDTGYRQQIPEISIANNAMAQMLKFIKEFGLTPKERAQLEATIIGNTIDQEMEDMIIK